MTDSAKDPTIQDLLRKLDLSSRGWQVVDHWEGDLCATGVGRRDDPRRLVYISTFDRQPGKYDFESEAPTGSAATDYETVAAGQDVTFEQLLEAIQRHLDSS